MAETEATPVANLTQKQRLLALLLNAVLLVLLARLVTGECFPSSPGRRLWLLSGLGLFFLTLLAAPWFRPPRNALPNAVTAALLLSSLDLAGLRLLNTQLNAFRWVAVAIALVTSVCAVLAMVFADADPLRQTRRKYLGSAGYRLANTLGRGELAFTPPALISILGYYQDDPVQQLWLLFGWVSVVSIRPVDLALRLIVGISSIRSAAASADTIGTIMRVDNPNIVRVALSASSTWTPSTVVTACLPNGIQVNVLCLFSHVEESQLVGTGLCHGAPPTAIADAVPTHVYRRTEDADAARILRELSGDDRGADLVGFVVEDSNIATIRFEVSPHAALEEGRLTFCRQGDRTIFYQVLDARTAEEVFGRNPRGKHVAIAAQLGCLDRDRGFVKYGWLPAMNSLVFVPAQPIAFDAPSSDGDTFVVGKVPGSDIAVRASLSDVLEYHTAILGVTGTGKTELALDIIKHALSVEMKVFCVDFTNEYKTRLAEHAPQLLGLPQAQAEELDQRLFAVETGTFGAPNEKKALKQFVDEIREPIRASVDGFLLSKGPSLGIFELPEITNTKATLRATELYLSSIMDWARKNRRARRVLLVLEEAHTVIPETAGSGFDHDTQWVVGRISQIALQGRKYGVGLLIISQRTALVSKSILSQCNTCITFSLVDKTSMDYLSNVYSQAHVQSIPNLRFLEALVYGKAVRSERPLLVKLEYDSAKKTASESLTSSLRGPKVDKEAALSASAERGSTDP